MMSVSKLLLELQNSKRDDERVHLLDSIAWELKDESPDKAIGFAQKMIHLALALSNDTYLCDAYNTMGVIYKSKGNYDLALEYFYKSMNLLEGTKLSTKLARAYGNMGIVHACLGNFEKALSFYYKSLKVGETLGHKDTISNTYNNLGLLFELQNDLDTALTYHMKSLKEYTKEKNKKGMAYANNNTANIYKSKGELDIAKTYYRKALSSLEISGNKYGMAHSYCQLGEVFLISKDYPKALNFFFKARAIQEEIIDKRGEAESLKNIANVYICQGKANGALAFSRSSLKMAIEIKSKTIIKDAYKSLSDSFKMIGKYKKAYEYFEHYVAVKEVLYNEEKSRTINTLHSRFEAEKKDERILQLNKKQQFLQKINEDLKEFTSKASHDLKEPLRMITSFGSILEKKADSLDEMGVECVKMINTSSQRMYRMLEDLLEFAVAGIRPENLEPVNLNELLDQVKNNLYLNIKETKTIIESTELPNVITFNTGIVQLFQNLLSNSIKFMPENKCPHIRISATEEQSTYTLEFADNGIGIPKNDQKKVFDIFNRIHPKDRYEGSGIGLATCKRIVDNLGGTISLESEEGKGTTFFITFPKKPLILDREF